MTHVELCALCGRAIPYFSHEASEADQELSAFDTLPNGEPAHGVCIDSAPLFGWAVARPREVAA